MLTLGDRFREQILQINRRVFTTVRFRLQNQYILSYDNYSGHHPEYGSLKESICLTLRRVLRDAADGEIILDEIIVFHTILYAPRHKRLVLLLERGGIIVDWEVEVVHGKLGPTRPVKGG